MQKPTEQENNLLEKNSCYLSNLGARQVFICETRFTCCPTNNNSPFLGRVRVIYHHSRAPNIVRLLKREPKKRNHSQTLLYGKDKSKTTKELERKKKKADLHEQIFARMSDEAKFLKQRANGGMLNKTLKFTLTFLLQGILFAKNENEA